MHRYVRYLFNPPIQMFDKIIPLSHQSKMHLNKRGYITKDCMCRQTKKYNILREKRLNNCQSSYISYTELLNRLDVALSLAEVELVFSLAAHMVVCVLNLCLE